MSKGPGKWQKRILAELEIMPAFYLGTLLGPKQGFAGTKKRPGTASQYSALIRAASTLENAGKINAHRFAFGVSRTVIYRLNYPFSPELRKLLDGVSVNESPSSNLINTYDAVFSVTEN